MPENSASPAPPVAGGLTLSASRRVRLTDSQALNELRTDLLRAAYQPGEVHLDSGVDQPYFFDKYLIVAKPAILRRLGRFLAARVPQGSDRVAAPTLGAVPLGTAVSLETGLPLAVVRSHSTPGRRGQPVEGGLSRGETVCLVEDVVVTGTRAAAGVDQLRNAGAEVTAVICVIDCERGADARLRSLGVSYHPLFRYSALFAAKEK